MRILSIFLVMVFSLAACQEATEKAAQPNASRHTEPFNSSVDALLNDYKTLSEAFVAWDSTGILSAASRLEASIRNVKLDGAGNDTVSAGAADSLAKVQQQVTKILAEKEIALQRRHFDTLSSQLFGALTAAKYDAKPLYLQKCPMAFNDMETAYWITDTGRDSIRNPYLGTRHPKYGSGMLECGENVKTLSR